MEENYPEAQPQKATARLWRAEATITAGESEPSGGALHVGGVQPLVTGLNLELDFLPFGECLEAVHRDGGEMHEHVVATFLLNETVALGVIEPLHFSLGHASCLL